MKDLPSYQNRLIFYVNGQKVDDQEVDPRTTLAAYLRQKLQLTGTKIGCNEGGCGACTVMISELTSNGEIKNYSVNSCLTLVCSIHGKAVTTVEGIGSVRSKLHPVQEALSQGHGSQCGFCTPGFVMAMYSLLRNNPKPEKYEIDEALQGNLCRCTGYRPILESFYTFSETESCCSNKNCCTNGDANGCTGGACCKNNVANGCGGCCNDGDAGCCKNLREDSLKLGVESDDKLSLINSSKRVIYDATQDPVFPSELRVGKYNTEYLRIEHDACKWFRPVTLEQLLELKQIFPHAKFVVGNSEIGVEMKFRNCNYPVLINPIAVPELNVITNNEHGIFVGAAVSLSDTEKYFKKIIKDFPDHKTKIFRAFTKMLHWFAGKHIRNTASAAGNLMTASPISDLNPLFMASGSAAIVQSSTKGRREVAIDGNFFPAYRKTSIDSDEVLVGIQIPFSSEVIKTICSLHNEHFAGYKQAQRREDDISIVNAGMKVRFKTRTNIVDDVRLSFGGMAPTTVFIKEANKFLVGREWNNDLLEDVTGKLLLTNLSLPWGVPGGMEKYRQTLCLSFFYKFFLTVAYELEKQGVLSNVFNDKVQSTIEDYQYTPMFALSVYKDVPKSQESYDAVGRPEMHLSGEKHTTGEALYCDDVQIAGAAYASFVISKKGHAKIIKVDPTEALAIPGVISYVDYRDIPKRGINKCGVGLDEEIFAEKEVTAFGQIIGLIAAETVDISRRAAELVKVDYEGLPTVMTIDQAIEAESYLVTDFEIKADEPTENLGEVEQVFEGEVRMGGQEHFYLETQSCIVMPREGDELEVISSTQNVCDLQMQLSRTLGISAHKIVVKVKRVGGGFGGKETAAVMIALPCAVAALKLRRPVRCYLERFDDMAITGTRHPYLGKYKMSYTKDGKFTAYQVMLYGNGGCSSDLSYPVLERAIWHSDNTYKIQNFNVSGKVCKTNISSSTAFRGFGAPQSMFIMEHCVTDVAYSLGVSPESLREKNFYAEGDKTFFGQKLVQCNIRRCWDQCIEMSDFHNRRQKVDEYNRKNRWRKRGIAVIPTKFGIAFGLKFLMQAGALVHIYRDGSVLISHCGMEMGQGLHTKMAQVATRTLGIPLNMIYINDTSTDKVPNCSATAASTGSDLNGGAVKNACDILLERLKPVMADNPTMSWSQIVETAYKMQINLSANGFYKVDDIPQHSSGRTLLHYYTYGAGCSEVEIDCLTGDHHVLRTDIVMDVGDSLNPAVDIGQIEGAFIQGYGLYTMEELKYSPSGVLYTRGPGNYKIPSADDIPKQFNVKLLKGSSNPKAIFSSKAVGEPPLFLGSSVFFAIKDAIKSAREEVGLKGAFRLDSPATPEKIRLACEDTFTTKLPNPNPGSFTPWTVEL